MCIPGSANQIRGSWLSRLLWKLYMKYANRVPKLGKNIAKCEKHFFEISYQI